MRKAYIVFFSLLLSVPCFAQNNPMDNALQLFFNALKTGDVTVVDSYIGGRLQQRIRPLLLNNPGYPQLLRDHYAGSSMSIINSRSVSDKVLVDVQINFSDKTEEQIIFYLKLDDTGDWKIIEQKMVTTHPLEPKIN